MKKIILKYGLLSGSIIALLMMSTTLIIKSIGYEKVGLDNAAYIGQSTILVSMLVIYFGVKSYRDNQNNGKITFVNALLVGLGIMIISCIAYSLTWLVVYYNFLPNFIDDYATYYIDKMKSTGSTQAEINQKLKEMQGFKSWYSNPFSIFLITLIEPLPVALVVVLISALILKRR